MRLKDKVVIITGAGQGIGRVYAHRFAEEGAKVVIAEYNELTGKKVADEIIGKGYQARLIRTDVTDEKSTQAMAKETIDQYGRIDVLINNAAAFSKLRIGPFDQISVEEWDRVMAVNLRGPWLCCKAVIPFMKAQGRGKIINTASDAWDIGRPFYLHYVTSKAGTVGLTRGLAREVGDWNINVNSVSYPGIRTEIDRKSFTPEAQEQQVQLQCLKRLPLPEELVGTVMFLASEDGDFLTGQNIHANGGRSFH